MTLLDLVPWAALVCTLVGLWGLGSARPNAFLWAITGNLLWIGGYYSDLPIVLTNVAILVVNVRGYLRLRHINNLAKQMLGVGLGGYGDIRDSPE